MKYCERNISQCILSCRLPGITSTLTTISLKPDFQLSQHAAPGNTEKEKR